jgi:hypothetical protein
MATCYELLAASGLSGLALGGCRHIHTGWGLWATSAQVAVGFISPEPVRLNGNTLSWQAACLPPRREGAQTMRRVRSVSPLPNHSGCSG